MSVAGVPCAVYDFEVFAEDWLLTVLDAESEEVYRVWNDPDQAVALVGDLDEAGYAFFGYNSSHYDRWVMLGLARALEPRQVKEVNDYIIGGGEAPWEHPLLKGPFWTFPDVDLMKDTQKGTSLKSIESHMGWDVEESSVPFDIDRALTPEERAETEHYCLSDVRATARLLEMRRDYLETKVAVGERGGLEARRAMSMTNARLTALVLGATRREYGDERDYRYPDALDRSFVPPEALAFFDRVRDPSVPDEELWRSKCELDLRGCPAVLGFGGIHAAREHYSEVAGEGRAILNVDVSSYYPHMMVKLGYASRSMADPGALGDFLQERLEAKAAGDKARAKPLKLVLNGAYGATLADFNDLCDRRQARSVCITGQLLLLELACRSLAECPSMTLIQLNTDGLMCSLAEAEVGAFRSVCAEWEARTGFPLEEDRIECVYQANCNNYVERQLDGSVKVKGGWLTRGVSDQGAWSVNNDARVVPEAVVAWLLDGTPIAETVGACDDPSMFQFTAKASGLFSRVFHETAAGPVDVNRCNRAYAALDPSLGTLYKVRASDGQVSKMPGLPERCLVRNRGQPDMAELDRGFYERLAERRAKEYGKEGDCMAAARTQQANAEAAPANVYAKLARARRMFLEEGVRKSGVNRHLEFEYFELDDLIPPKVRIFDELGLCDAFRIETPEFENEGPGHAVLKVFDAGDPDGATVEFSIPLPETVVVKNRAGENVTNPLQAAGSRITYLRRYLTMLEMDVCEPDETDAGLGEEATKEAKAPAKAAAKAAPKRASAAKPATEARRKETVAALCQPEGQADGKQVAALAACARNLKAKWGAEHPEVAEYIRGVAQETSNFTDISRARCEEVIRELGEMARGFEAVE